jgi:hypothetical protein
MYGKSTSNHRIEAWWGQLRKNCAQWWMDHFKTLKTSGLFCDANIIHQKVFEVLLYPRYQARAKSRSNFMEHISYTSGQETKKFPLVDLMFCLCYPKCKATET